MTTFLTIEDMERVHQSSLHVLEKVGVRIYHPEVVKRLKTAGALVCDEGGLLRFSRDMVEESLHQSPKSFSLFARNPKYNLNFPPAESAFYTRTNTGAPHYVAPRTNEYRETIGLSEIEEWVRLADSLEYVDLICSPFPGDVPLKTADLYAMKTMLLNSSKHIIIQPYTEESLPFIAEMAVTVAGSKAELEKRPIISIFSCSTSPLVYKSMDVEVMKIGAEYGIPVHIASLPTMGGTAPVTAVGTILLANVEFLAGNLIRQALKPGAPVVYVSHKFAIDMVSGNILGATVEAMKAAAAHAQFVKERYGIPFQTIASINDSFVPDRQSMIERVFGSLLVASQDVTILAGLGSLACANAVSLSQLVIDNDIMAMIGTVRRGIKVNDENLALAAISEVGPGGHFIDHDHTLNHCREIVYPLILNRKSIEEWLREGKRDVVENAEDIAADLIKSHKGIELTDDVASEVDRIVRRADNRLI